MMKPALLLLTAVRVSGRPRGGIAFTGACTTVLNVRDSWSVQLEKVFRCL